LQLAGRMPDQAFTERTFAFACQVVRVYRTLSRTPNFPIGIARQLLHAGTSVGANVEESRAASSKRDLAARLGIALREARETKYWLRLIVATDLAPDVPLGEALAEVDELVAILTTTVRRLRQG